MVDLTELQYKCHAIIGPQLRHPHMANETLTEGFRGNYSSCTDHMK